MISIETTITQHNLFNNKISGAPFVCARVRGFVRACVHGDVSLHVLCDCVSVCVLMIGVVNKMPTMHYQNTHGVENLQRCGGSNWLYTLPSPVPSVNFASVKLVSFFLPSQKAFRLNGFDEDGIRQGPSNRHHLTKPNHAEILNGCKVFK